MSDTMKIVFGMMLVTYIPRVIPFYILSGKDLPKPLKLFLEFLPYTALGALIIPGALTAIPNEPIISIIGIIVAVVFAFTKGGMFASILGSISAVYLMLLF